VIESDQTADEVETGDYLSWPTLGRVEIDRYCDGCHYNLITQAVRLDERTGLLMARCPECGRFHAANRYTTAVSQWTRRMAPILFGLWILLLVSLYFGIAFGSGGITGAFIDSLINFKYIRTSTDPSTPVLMQLTLRDVPKDEYWVIMCWSLFGQISLGLISGIGMTVVFPHWRRSGYVLVALITTFLVSLTLYIGWCLFLHGGIQDQDMRLWLLRYIGLFQILFLCTCLIGILFGRAIARLSVRVFLPSTLRTPFIYLWMVDEKEPPATIPAPRGERYRVE